ncbi:MULTISPECIES: sugar dehydrogenase complex small subunit [Gluconobacter]|uniref:sugar dehydrogenase complex small subunit n=1 Tax=Gluconobacter TaxID=441 RepID=UPI0007CF2402|nr:MULTISPECIES: sugar dehydrogenase complex small subunit [Gluconobacter]OAG72467.1 sorbitol dehydrogenase [Gluconobacter japonicus]
MRISRSTNPRIGRRGLLLGMSSLSALFCVQATRAATLSGGALRSGVVHQKFMSVSSLLVPHKLNEAIGMRTADAMIATVPDFPQHLEQLASFIEAKKPADVEELMEALPEVSLKNAAQSIIESWYTGAVQGASTISVISYEEALMFKVTSDVMTIPSYAISGPNGWTADAPPLSQLPIF